MDDVLAAPFEVLCAAVGARVAGELVAAARGVDHRRVSPERATRSIGVERTYEFDLETLDEVRDRLVDLAAELAARLRAHDARAAGLTLKVRYSDFSTITRSRTVTEPLQASTDIRALAHALAEEVAPERGIRLLGLAAAGLREAGAQLSLLDGVRGGAGDLRSVGAHDHVPAAGGSLRVAAEAAGDRVRERFGNDALGWRTANE